MGKIPNTLRRDGHFHFRRSVPKSIRPALRRNILVCSLQTSIPAVARSRSRIAYVRSENLFEYLVAMPSLTESDIHALVRRFYDTIIERDDFMRLTSDEPISDAKRLALAEHYETIAENSRRDLANNALGSARQVSIALLAERFGMDATFPELDRRRAMQALLRAGIDLSESLAARHRGDFNYEPKDKLLVAALQAALADPISNTTNAAEPEPTPHPAVEVEIAAAPLFSKTAEEFRQSQLRRNVWEKQTAHQARATFELLSAALGDRQMADYRRNDAKEFKNLLEDLPQNYAKAARFKGMDARQIAESTKAEDLVRLAPRTVQRHFHALSSLWQDAMEHGTTIENPFDGWKFIAAKRARDQRKMWDSEDLATLFSSPIWSGCQSENRRSKPGSLILRDEKFWLPLIAVFSGMRQEEICQLRVADIQEVDGIWFFDLRADNGQMLKNSNAVRRVPVHKHLQRIGFLHYVVEQRRQSQNMLFPDLKPGGADGRLGHNYSKWFTRYRRDISVYADKLDFHSFRHSATTFMKRAGVSDTTIDEVTGHATAGEIARYSKGLTMPQLQAAIDAIDIGVDLSALETLNATSETAP